MNRNLSIFTLLTTLLTACSLSKNPQLATKIQSSVNLSSKEAKTESQTSPKPLNTYKVDLLETLPRTSKKICNIIDSEGSYISKIITTDSGLYMGRTTLDHVREFQGKELLEIGPNIYAHSYNDLHLRAWYNNEKRDFRKKINSENPYTIELVSFDEKDPTVKGSVSSLFFIRGDCEFLARKDDFKSLVSFLFLIENKNDYTKEKTAIFSQKSFEPNFAVQKERFDLGSHSTNACLIDTCLLYTSDAADE